jgi:hypothetical protein
MSSSITVDKIKKYDSSYLDIKGDVVVEEFLPVENDGYSLRNVQRMYRLDDSTISTTHGYLSPFNNTNASTVPPATTRAPQNTQWPDFGICMPNSKIYLEVYFPVYNGYTGWGGMYFSLNMRFLFENEYDYTETFSLGNSGHSMSMNEGDEDYEHYRKSFWIDPGLYDGRTKVKYFSVNFVWRGRTNNDTAWVSNRYNDVNRLGDYFEHNQHNTHFYPEMIIYEYANAKSIDKTEENIIYDPSIVLQTQGII